jgi:hypothetical protein
VGRKIEPTGALLEVLRYLFLHILSEKLQIQAKKQIYRASQSVETNKKAINFWFSYENFSPWKVKVNA